MELDSTDEILSQELLGELIQPAIALSVLTRTAAIAATTVCFTLRENRRNNHARESWALKNSDHVSGKVSICRSCKR
jgi:hypothetical protein